MAEEQLTHAGLLVQYEQSALRRYLDLDKLMPLIIDRGILKAKRGEKIRQNKDITLFLALLKKKKVETFVDFLKCLQQTFDGVENHRFLVNCMSSELLVVKAPPEAQDVIRTIVEAAEKKTKSYVHESTRTEETQLEFQRQETLTSLQPGTHESTQATRTKEEKTQQELQQQETLTSGTHSTHESTQATRTEEELQQQETPTLISPTTQSGTHEATQATRTEAEQETPTLISPTTQSGTHEATQATRTEEEKMQQEQETLTSKLEETSLEPQQSGTHNSTQATEESTCVAVPPKGYVEPCRSECFTSNSGVFYCPSHGVTIDIPEGAVLPDSRGKFMVSMYAYLNGPFEVPSGAEPCTAILLLRVHPYQEFLKPVKLTVPHCAVIEDEDTELFFLQASEPADGTSTYRFTNELEAECAEDGYHMEAEVNHFSATVGCRRSSTRQQKSRRSSTKKSPVRRRRLRNSIERTTPNLVKKTSSAASDNSSLESSSSLDVAQGSTKLGEVRTRSRCKKRMPSLTRQDALDSQDTNMGEGQLSTASSKSLYRLHMARWSHQHGGDSWKETFIVACSLPSTSLALRWSIAKDELDEQSFVSVADVLRFRPEKWSECGWEVEATKNPILYIHHLSPLVVDDSLRLSYLVKCKRDQKPGYLSCRVVVDGAEVDGKPLYFQITSPPPPAGFVSTYNERRRLYTWAGLYKQESHIVMALESGTESSLRLDTQSDDIRKLLADISYQLTADDYSNLCSRLELSRPDIDRIETCHPGNLTEHLYLMLIDWVKRHSGASFRDLLSIFSEFGISEIGVTHKHDSDLVNMCYRVGGEMVKDDRACSCGSAQQEQSPSFILSLSCMIVHPWRFVARFLGVTEGDIDSIDYNCEPVSEKVFQILRKWMTLKGREATYRVLLRALYRVYERDYRLCHAWNFTKSQLL